MRKHTDVEADLQKLIDHQHAPSAQYLIFDRDSIIFSYANGLADIAGNRIADQKTTYHVYSVTKTITAHEKFWFAMFYGFFRFS